MAWRGLLEPGVQGNYDPQTWRGVTPVVPAKAPPQTPYRDVNQPPAALPTDGFKPEAPYSDGGTPRLGSGVPTQTQINGVDSNKIALGPNDGTGGGFTSGKGVSYNVNDTSQPGVSRVTATGQRPLYTNINPKDAVGGLKDQMVGGDPTEGLTRTANANAIRQSMIDSQPAGFSGVIRDTSNADREALFSKWANEALMRDASSPTATRGQIALAQQVLSNQGALNTAVAHNQGNLDVAGVQGNTQRDVAGLNAGSHLAGIGLQTQGARDVAGIQGKNQMDVERMREGSPLSTAQARLANSQAGNFDAQAAAGKVDPYLPVFSKMFESGMLDPKDPQHAAVINHFMGQMINHVGGQAGQPPQAAVAHLKANPNTAKDFDAKFGQGAAAKILGNNYANGGIIDRALVAVGLRKPAPQPQPQQPQPQTQPQDQQPQQQPRGLSVNDAANAIRDRGRQLRELDNYAEGGPIDVGGRQVIGAGDGKSDSLPARIDGAHPAALSTGEFVMPVEAVQHFGTAKLNKMVEQARRGVQSR